MPLKATMLDIAKHVELVVNSLDDSQIDYFIKEIKNANRVFIMGVGRSGLVSRSFAMRLVQLGFKVYVIGETTTPALKKEDILIVVSGSGATRTCFEAAEVAVDIGTEVIAITSYPKSRLGRISDALVVIKGRTKIDIEKNHMKNQLEGKHSSLTPLGTLFEDAVMIFFDGIIAKLMTDLKRDERYMKETHATIE